MDGLSWRVGVLKSTFSRATNISRECTLAHSVRRDVKLCHRFARPTPGVRHRCERRQRHRAPVHEQPRGHEAVQPFVQPAARERPSAGGLLRRDGDRRRLHEDRRGAWRLITGSDGVSRERASSCVSEGWTFRPPRLLFGRTCAGWPLRPEWNLPYVLPRAA